MKFRLYVGVAAAGSLLLASQGWAGQAGSLFTDATITTNEIASDSTVTVGGIEILTTISDATSTEAAIELDSQLVTLSLQVYEDGYHGNSPSNNIAAFGDEVSNTAGGIDDLAGISTIQQSAGQANVSIAVTTLVDVEALVAATGFEDGTLNSAGLPFILSPAFTLSNSKQAAQALAILALGEAQTDSGGGIVGDVTAIEFISNDSYELSPEGNLADFAGVVTNLLEGAAGLRGISTIQQQAGQANVQSAFTTILFAGGGGIEAFEGIVAAP